MGKGVVPSEGIFNATSIFSGGLEVVTAQAFAVEAPNFGLVVVHVLVSEIPTS